MKKYKISAEDFDKVSIKRLATNPGARSEYGESSMKGEALKERMDKPFELFKEKFNMLVELIVGTAEGDNITKYIPTGITQAHTLFDMIRDVTSEGAEFAAYLSVGERTLLEALKEIDNALSSAKEHAECKSNPHKVTAGQLGLERVDNTSDEEKPLSAAVRAALEAEALARENAIAGCVPKSSRTDGQFIYTTAAEEPTVQLARERNGFTAARRYTDGRLKVGEPVADEDAVTKRYSDATKVGKVGDQVINGGLSISGDLFVGGDTYAKQIESLEVGDAVIIANADGVLLSELSGYVIRVNGASAYAIVYDPIDDCVKIGLGTYDSESKVFIFGEGEAQVLATRGVIADGNIPVWNDEKKTFEDSKLSATAIDDMISDMETTAAEVNAALVRINELADAYIGDEATGESGGEE